MNSIRKRSGECACVRSAHSIRFDRLCLFSRHACYWHIPYFSSIIHHHHSPAHNHRRTVFVRANLLWKSTNHFGSLVCIHYASMSTIVIVIAFNMLLTCKLIDRFYTYLLIPIFLVRHFEAVVSCLGWLFFTRDTHTYTWNGAPQLL